MILKVEDALKSLRRTDPDCEARRDLRGLYLPAETGSAGRFPTACRLRQSYSDGSRRGGSLDQSLIKFQK